MWSKVTALLGVIIICLSLAGMIIEGMDSSSQDWPPGGYKDHSEVNILVDDILRGSELHYAGEVSQVRTDAIVLDNGSMFIFFEPLSSVKVRDLDVEVGDRLIISVWVGEIRDCTGDTSCDPNFNFSGREWHVAAWNYKNVDHYGPKVDDTPCAIAGLILGSVVLLWAFMMHRKEKKREIASGEAIDRIIKRLDRGEGSAVPSGGKKKKKQKGRKKSSKKGKERPT